MDPSPYTILNMSGSSASQSKWMCWLHLQVAGTIGVVSHELTQISTTYCNSQMLHHHWSTSVAPAPPRQDMFEAVNLVDPTVEEVKWWEILKSWDHRIRIHVIHHRCQHVLMLSSMVSWWFRKWNHTPSKSSPNIAGFLTCLRSGHIMPLQHMFDLFGE